MLRPEQILNAKFTPVNKGTYSADEVDSFLKSVAESYEESLNQNKELIKKISILADKIESYRNDEEAIKLALLDAHKMSETINKNAKTKADDILTDAETRSKIILDGASRQANQSIDEAKEKAKEIVDNARTAVASLTERAQIETESTIKSAQAKAAEIISQAQAEGKQIIGNSKESFEFYSAELTKVKAETLKFKETIQELCKGQLNLLDGMPEFIAAVNAVSSVAEQVPVENNTEEASEVVIEEDNAAVISDEITVEKIVDDDAFIPEIISEPAFDSETESESDFSEIEEIEEEALTFAPEIITEDTVENYSEEPVSEESVPEVEEDDDLFSFIDSMRFDDFSNNISSSIDDLLPDIAVEDESEDEFDGFKVDLDSIDEIGSVEDSNNSNINNVANDDDDFSSLFDSMFED